MLINKDALAAVINTVVTVWQGALAAVKATWTEWAYEAPSTSAGNDYKWWDLLVQIREWVGPRKEGNVKAQKWLVPNKNYEGSFALDKNDIEDDNLGMLPGLTTSLLNGAMLYPEQLLFQLEIAGFNTACFDGQYFFDSDHPALADDGTTVSNVSTLPFTYDNLRTALVTFLTLKGAGGNPLDLEVYEVHVGPKYIETAKDYFNNQYKPGGAGEDNALKGRVKPRCNPYFTDTYAEYWVLLAKPRGGVLTPFMYQNRKAPELSCTAMSAGDSISGGVTGQDLRQWTDREIGFGVEMRGAVTFTLWPLAYGCTGTGL